MIKSNKAYYLFQLLGTLFFCSIIIALGVSAKIAEEGEVSALEELTTLIKIIVLYLLISHFLLRKHIKKHAKNSQHNFKSYLVGIIYSALLLSLINAIWGVFLGDPDKNYFSAMTLLGSFIFSCIGFILWSLLYIAITSIRDKRLLARQLKEQQLASLMNQINPHFLFNSLNTIRGMIYEDKDKSAELVTQLSTLFRYNLSIDTKAHTSLGEELEVCQQYLAIEDIRLGSRLSVKLNISPESKKAKIPTMGILTLVENAIKHGISHLQQGGTLTINTLIENGQVKININNPYQENFVKSGTQVGLKNLKQRMMLIFGNEATLSESKDDEFFNVDITLPFQAQ
jgi:hypothetical protein